jgi:hypothetical protein
VSGAGRGVFTDLLPFYFLRRFRHEALQQASALSSGSTALGDISKVSILTAAEILVRLPKNIRDIAWKAQTRLCTRYRSLIARGKKPTVVVAAIARELAGFIWAIGQEMRAPMTA